MEPPINPTPRTAIRIIARRVLRFASGAAGWP
jgi:hypothetical protein